MNVIRHIRTQIFGISQAEMAGIAEVSQPTVSKWENDEASPNREELARIRSAAMTRELPWSDSLFFDAPAVSQ